MVAAIGAMLAGRSAVRSALLAALALLAVAPAAAQDEVRDRRLERAERRFAQAQEERDAAYRDLRRDYEACAAWIAGDELRPPPPPDTLARWFRQRDLAEAAWGEERARLAAAGPFHELWNGELYKRSRAARRYREAQQQLERAFHALEKLRHPERYQRGFAETPPGMTLIPAGTYTLAPATGYLIGHPDLQEPREVRLAGFYLDRNEVTCADYARFLLSLPAGLREEHLPADWSWAPDGSPMFPDGHAAVPVTGVSWASAASYAEWAGKRLPTEDEWQAAAAGFGARAWPIGDRFDAAKVNCLAFGAGRPLAAAEIPEDSTPQGVVGLSGNVREWCADLFQAGAGDEPARRATEVGPETVAVVRGGSFQDRAEACASTFRWLYPALGTRLPTVGFRYAMDVP
ncbi:MAG: hypothetical protein D6702_10900 [Planctomycetota bacterium]|nr:MAG: hypothetical protein D6702_10900 [Planctomycetota bacterium]